MILRVPGFLLLISIVIQGCKNEVGKQSVGNFPPEVSKILVANCTGSGCHNDNSQAIASDFNLLTWDKMFRGSSNGSPVIPYSSRFSSMCYFINRYPDLGPVNEPSMPLNGTPLNRQEVQTIKTWIDNGAPDVTGRIMGSDPNLAKMYIVNQGCGVVTVIDRNTRLPIRYVQVGTKNGKDMPHSVRVSPDKKYWYVVFVKNNIMQKFRCSDDQLVGSIPLTPAAAGTGVADAMDWNTMIFTHDGTKGYCASYTPSGKIAAVDLVNMKLLHFVGGLYYPHGVALNKTEDQLFVGAQTGNFLTVIDTGFTNSDIAPLGNVQDYSSSLDLHEMAISPDGSELWITCQKTNDVRVFNLASRKVTAIIPTGLVPQEIVFSPLKGRYYVTCTEDSTQGARGTLTEIDGTTHATKQLAVGYQPHGVAVDDNFQLLYVVSRNISVNGPLPHHTGDCDGRNGFVNFIDLNNLTILPQRFELSSDPYYAFPR